MKKVIIDSGLTLIDPSMSEVQKIREALTFPNPAYEQAVRFSPYGYVAVPEYVKYFTRGRDSIRMPLGFDVENYVDVEFEDLRKTVHAEVPEFKLTLREDQKIASEKYLELNKEHRRGMIQMPTGKGKSILALYVAHALKQKTLVIVHKNDLVTGWQKDIKLSFGDVDTGLIKAKDRRVGTFITIATVQTLNRMSNEDLQVLFDSFGLVICDEQHHVGASSYDLIDRFNSRYKMGLSATPERTDGLTHVMALYFGDFCYQYEHTDDEQDILPVRAVVRTIPLYLDPVCEMRERGRSSGYSIKLLDAPRNYHMQKGEVRLSRVPYKKRPRLSYHDLDDYVVTHPRTSSLVVADILSEYQEGHSCIAFFTRKAHIEMYRDILIEKIGEENVSCYYGDNKNSDLVLEIAENKRQHVTLATYAKATEGTNVKQWEIAFLVSSLNNGKNVEQALGRIRRTKKNKNDFAKVYDYRFPEVTIIRGHGSTRDKRYDKMGVERFRRIFRTP